MTAPTGVRKMQYRPDIDGLRAIAILFVLSFHLSPPALSGGFFGVDVFFVISGYLITGILLTTGYQDFYKKRILRLFPALLFCMVLTYGIGYALLLDSELENLGKHVKSSMTFIENIRLKSEVGYFDAHSDSKPLLHLWSLAVEEQFYLLWPILLLGSKRFISPRVFIPLALVASLVYCFSLDSPSKAFYLAGARGWELAVGAMCYVYGHSGNRHPVGAASRLTHIVSWTVSLILLACAVCYQSSWQHPGPITLVPTIMSAALIACGPEASFNRLILSNPAIRYIGRISYPLYLFHWPLLAYAHVTQAGHPSLMLRISCLLMATIAAVAVHHLLERPVHRRANLPWSAPALAAGAVAMWLVGHFTVQSKGFPEREVAVQSKPLIDSMNLGQGKAWTTPRCGVPDSDKRDLPYCFSDARDTPTLAVWGDSKADAIYWGLVRSSRAQARWMVIGKYSCAPLVGVHRVSEYSGVSPQECQQSNQAALRALRANQTIHTVLLVTASRLLDESLYSSQSRPGGSASSVQVGMEATISALQEAGKRVVILIDNPSFVDPRYCLLRTPWAFEPSDQCSQGFNSVMNATRNYRDLIKSVAANTGVDVIDPTEALCDPKTERCSVFKNGESLYSYEDHYSDVGNGIVAREIIRHLEEVSAIRIDARD